MRRKVCCVVVVFVGSIHLFSAEPASAQYAARVVSYDPGTASGSGYEQPSVALGEPERFTGEGTGWDSVVSPFSAPWLASEIVKIGADGHLTLAFDTPITDDPDHLYGVDFIIFGNGAFVDDDWPNGVVGDPATTFGTDPMYIEVSEDGVDFVALGTYEEGWYPASGYTDGGPYDPLPGSLPSDFFKPVNPSLSLQDFSGLDCPSVLELYDGSGGGTPIDLSGSGLSVASYVRISVPQGVVGYDVEIDAVAVVPEPSSGLLVLLAIPMAFRRR